MSGLGSPWAMLAELTHRCPLHCVYCSNPLRLQPQSDELDTASWRRVLREAHDLGVVQAHLSGGEPLLRADLLDIAGEAAAVGIYTQLVTSGIGLTHAAARDLASVGLNCVQLSVQAAEPRLSDVVAGRRAFEAKQRAAGAVRAAGLPLGLNVVLHRHNLDTVSELVDLAVAWGAERIELANTQYYNWALRNRERLLPIREQVDRAADVVLRRREELRGRLEVIWVLPDYHEQHPKPCMGGWGSRSLTLTPDGTVLPCPAAASIPGLRFDTVRERSLAWIWRESPSFNAFRGSAWMPEPCRSCDRRDLDFGGCRCQAFALTGDASRTDPVCIWAPDHAAITEAVARAEEAAPALRGAVYRPGK